MGCISRFVLILFMTSFSAQDGCPFTSRARVSTEFRRLVQRETDGPCDIAVEASRCVPLFLEYSHNHESKE